MLEAQNQRGQRIRIQDACEHPREAYYCPGCGSRLVLRCGDERQCFAHQVGVAPECAWRVDEGFGGSLPRLGNHDDPREVGRALVTAFCKSLLLPCPKEGDAFVGSDAVTRAQLLVVHLAHQEWTPSRFQPDQSDAANVLSRLVSADLAGALRQILTGWIRKRGTSDLDTAPQRLRTVACGIKWGEYFSGMGEGTLLPSPWIECDGSVSLSYYEKQGRFGPRGGEIYRDVRYGTSAELEATGIRSHPLKLAWLYTDANGKRGFEIVSSNARSEDRIAVSHGETLIIFADPVRPACLYVVPASNSGRATLLVPDPSPTARPEPAVSPAARPEQGAMPALEAAAAEARAEEARQAEARRLAEVMRRAEEVWQAHARRRDEEASRAEEVRKAKAKAEEEARAAAKARVQAEGRAVDAARRYARSLTVPLEMVHIPGGTFHMGSGPDDTLASLDEQPRHEVTLSPYWIARTPITQKLYARVTGKRSGYKVDDDAPVTLVSWLGAVRFCNLLSKAHGLEPVYREDAGVWVTEPDADGYRLPTEAEWEYAARSADARPYPWGTAPPSPDLCWGAFGDGQWRGPYPVGGHPAGASAFGLLDMVGNVRELVADGHGPYVESAVVDPQGPDPRSCGPRRVLRGGGLRATSRTPLAMDARGDHIGFRCARGNFPPVQVVPSAAPAMPPLRLAPAPPRVASARAGRAPSSRKMPPRNPPAAPKPATGGKRAPEVSPASQNQDRRDGNVRAAAFPRCPYCIPQATGRKDDLEEHLWRVHGLVVDDYGRIVSRRR